MGSSSFAVVAALVLSFLTPSSLAQAPVTSSTAASTATATATSTVAPTSAITTGPTTFPTLTPTGFGNSTRLNATTTSNSLIALTGPPDVYLNVPTLSVGRIELDVENLQADVNLAAQVANLVTINAGVQASISKVNITITDVDVELELVVRLGNLVNIVNRVFESLDLNPLLIGVINNVTSILDDVAGDVAGLLGTITNGGTSLSFVIDNLGNIVQQVAGTAENLVGDVIVGNYQQNMTDTGVSKTLSNGLVQKTYEYSPLNALVDIVFNAAGQVVSATTQSSGSGSGSGSSSGSSAAGAAKRAVG